MYKSCQKRGDTDLKMESNLVRFKNSVITHEKNSYWYEIFQSYEIAKKNAT